MLIEKLVKNSGEVRSMPRLRSGISHRDISLTKLLKTFLRLSPLTVDEA